MVKITEQMVEVAARAMSEIDGFNWVTQDFNGTPNGNDPEEERNYRRDMARAALEAALSQGEAAEVADGPCHESDGCPTEMAVLKRHWRLTNPHTGQPRDYRDVNSDPEGFLCAPPGALSAATQPAPQSEPLTDELAEALAVGDGTMEGALQYWHQRALAAEAAQSEPALIGSWDWLRGVVSGLPKRVEPIGGQRATYVELDNVLGWINEGQKRAAVAATGKQSGSEPVPHRWDDVGERCLACGDKDWMADPSCRGAATESRETAGVEPVAVVGSDFTICWVGSGPIAPLVERNGIKKGSPLYAAPPAQGVDLGQFRPAVEAALRHSSPYGLARENLNRLLALIDQRDGEVG